MYVCMHMHKYKAQERTFKTQMWYVCVCEYIKIIFKDYTFILRLALHTFLKSSCLFLNEMLMMLVAIIVTVCLNGISLATQKTHIKSYYL